ncbi:hypothetical protein C5S32_10950 [ANME-1 cluster archaeon GoMg1]|nr:hypothetical protein [ANME-1 cluster archaeon GoMg1]
MKREDFFDEWKGDWKGRKEEFHTNQAELFRHVRDRKNLEIRVACSYKKKTGECAQ